jgi:hypothetical protein
MKIQYGFFFLLFFRDLAVCMKIKYIFFNVLTKIMYFNTEFVSLQYKKKTNIDQNTEKNWKIIDFLK